MGELVLLCGSISPRLCVKRIRCRRTQSEVKLGLRMLRAGKSTERVAFHLPCVRGLRKSAASASTYENPPSFLRGAGRMRATPSPDQHLPRQRQRRRRHEHSCRLIGCCRHDDCSFWPGWPSWNKLSTNVTGIDSNAFVGQKR